MNFDFDSDSAEEEQPSYTENEEDLNATQASSEGLDEAEKRIALAMYYRELTQIVFFDDGSEEARIIDNEVRQFARHRMEVLLGMKSSNAVVPGSVQALPFTPEQIEALKSLADHVLKKPKILSQGTQRPQVAQRPSTPKVPSPRRKPRLPEQVPVQQKDPVDVKPVMAQPQRPMPKPAPAQEVAAKKPLQVPRPASSVKPAPQKMKPEDVPDGEVFKQGGKLWKWETNELGTRFRKDVTVQNRAPTAVPMPSGESLSYATEQLAAQSVRQGAAITDFKLMKGGRPDVIDMGGGQIVRNYDPNGLPEGVG